MPPKPKGKDKGKGKDKKEPKDEGPEMDPPAPTEKEYTVKKELVNFMSEHPAVAAYQIIACPSLPGVGSEEGVRGERGTLGLCGVGVGTSRINRSVLFCQCHLLFIIMA